MRQPDETTPPAPDIIPQLPHHDWDEPAVTPQPPHHDWEGPRPAPPSRTPPPKTGPQPTPGIPLQGPVDPNANANKVPPDIRLRWQLDSRGYADKSEDADKFLLSLQADPWDRQYNAVLQQKQAEAYKRQNLREKYAKRSKDNVVDSATEEAIQADRAPDPTEHESVDSAGKRVVDYHQDVVVDAAGNPVGKKQPAGGKTPPAGSQTGTKIKNLNTGAVPGSDQDVRSGDFVFVGSDATNAPFGPGTTGSADMFMNTDDAKASIGGWTPEQLKSYQHAMGIAETGLPDDATFSNWSKVVDTAARMTAAGRNITLAAVALSTAETRKKKKGSGGGGGGGRGGGGGGRGRGGGGGGGGSGGGGFPKAEVQMLLTSITQKEIGRDPTQTEIDQFYSYFNAAGDPAGASQIATNWVRAHLGGEQGSYNAATKYYQAMMAVLGASGVGGGG